MMTASRLVLAGMVPAGIVVGLFVVHGLEIWLYAFAYRALGLFPDLEAALYVAASSYSTLGEAGGMLPKGWRVVGSISSLGGA